MWEVPMTRWFVEEWLWWMELELTRKSKKDVWEDFTNYIIYGMI